MYALGIIIYKCTSTLYLLGTKSMLVLLEKIENHVVVGTQHFLYGFYFFGYLVDCEMLMLGIIYICISICQM